MASLNFLTAEQAHAISAGFGTPVYVYDQHSLERNAKAALAFPKPFGLTVRYALKAAPNAAILRLFDQLGLHFDAGSGWEADRTRRAGIAAEKISLSSQELPDNLVALYEAGVRFNACSPHQLRCFGNHFPGARLGLRFNPGLGSGSTAKTNVGGPASSFGIWHEQLPAIQALVARYQLKIVRIHTHIGSGSDPAVWQRTATLSLELARQFPEVQTLNLGGGYKVGRMPNEASTDLAVIGAPIRSAMKAFAKKTGRRLHLEIEPGTFLTANAGAVITCVQDIVNTGPEGFTFLKLDAGMTDILRPSLYGAHHPLVIIPQQQSQEKIDYVVVGHCCESGDLLTPALGEAEVLQPRTLTRATIGDLCIIEGAGAYCSAMNAKNYNSFPEAPEVLVDKDGQPQLIRRRQTLAQMVTNELG